MRIGFFGVESWEKEFFRKKLPKDRLLFSKDVLEPKNAGRYKDTEVIAAFVHSRIDEQTLEKLPRLKLITTMSTGFDHIDLEACRKREIVVCNVPAYGENTIAEHAFTLILGLSKKLVDCVEKTRKGNFELKGLRGFDLQGKTLGVVGCGNIGRHVIKMAKGFEMEVLAFDLNRDDKFAKKMGFKYVEVDDLLANSDIVSLHVPLNKHTSHLIDKKKIVKMKKGAILINTSRGGIVDTDALVKALKKGKLSGAGLDVLEEEEGMIEGKERHRPSFAPHHEQKIVLENRALLKMPNVLVTPHNAFNTKEALERILEVTVTNIEGFRKGRPVNLVR